MFFFFQHFLWRPVSRKSFTGRTWTTVGCTGASALSKGFGISRWEIPVEKSVSLPATKGFTSAASFAPSRWGSPFFNIFITGSKVLQHPPKLQLKDRSPNSKSAKEPLERNWVQFAEVILLSFYAQIQAFFQGDIPNFWGIVRHRDCSGVFPDRGVLHLRLDILSAWDLSSQVLKILKNLLW